MGIGGGWFSGVGGGGCVGCWGYLRVIWGGEVDDGWCVRGIC